jgi:type II secretory pathway component PulK
MRAVQRQEHGFVLVAVLWIMVILTVLTMGFSHRVVLERRGARYMLDKEQAQSMARGAVYRAMLELRNKPVFDELSNQTGLTTRHQRWARPIDMFTEAVYYQEPRELGIDSDICWARIEDCESRISLNTAPMDLLRNMKALRGTQVKRIEARRKPEGQFAPYFFAHRDEIMTIKGVSERAWYGDGKDVPLREQFTVWGDTDGKINVNTASEEVLALLPELDRDVMTKLFAYRNGDDEVFGTPDDRVVRDLNRLARLLEVSAEKVGPLQQYCKVDSQFFIIRTGATLRSKKIRAYCEVVVELTGGTVRIQDWSEEIDAA